MKRALFVGLNDYPSPNELDGCVSDATQMRDLLAAHEDDSPNFDGQLLVTANDVTTHELQRAITELLEQPAEVALFYFSGHGELNQDLQGVLVTADASEANPGVTMEELLNLANASPVQEVFIILDCCHSGAFGQMQNLGRASLLREGVCVLTASRGGQAAVEEDGHGVFTSHVLAALSGEAADILGKVTAASVYAYLDEILGAWRQRPLFKANVSRLQSLRTCNTQVPIGILRELPLWFAEAATEMPLDPSFEPTVEPRHEENERTFGKLQKLRAARLVEPVGEDHMYFAAMNSKACRLTKLGQFYWRRAKDRRL